MLFHKILIITLGILDVRKKVKDPIKFFRKKKDHVLRKSSIQKKTKKTSNKSSEVHVNTNVSILTCFLHHKIIDIYIPFKKKMCIELINTYLIPA